MITELLQARSSLLADVERAPRGAERLLLRSDLSGTMQLYELDREVGLNQVTDLPEPVSAARYLPRQRRAVVQVDHGGDERYQLYLARLDGPPNARLGPADLARVTDDDRYVHQLAGVAPHEDLLAYVSNRRNEVDFDVWLYDLESRQHRLAYDGGGWCLPASGFSPDGRWLSVLRSGPRPLDTDLLLIDIRSGECRVILPHPDEAALVGPPAWACPDIFYFSASVGAEWRRPLRYDMRQGQAEEVDGTAGHWDAEVVTSPDGAALCVIENRDGASYARLSRPRETAAWTEVPLPRPAVVAHHFRLSLPQFSFKGDHLYVNLTSPEVPGDIWLFDVGAGTLSRRTESPFEVRRENLVEPQAAETTSFDGERIPLFIFRPGVSEGPPPVVVMVHGGPESQAMLTFDPLVQAVAAQGYAVVVPNVRGSTGYGKRYAALDDGPRRLDAVRDLAAVHAFLERAGLDSGRAALWGGSYGGYMVLAGLAFQPELWAAGVDIVGISDLTTFLENTSSYRRAQREREYGSLASDREFLERASPLRHADAIRAPLFVVHGRNDPRVPVSEAHQLVARLRDRGTRCELLVYEDEGHGLARLANRLDAFPKAIAFLDEVLAPRP